MPQTNSYIDDIKWKNAEGICLKRVCIIYLEKKNSFSMQDMFKVTGNKVKTFLFHIKSDVNLVPACMSFTCYH